MRSCINKLSLSEWEAFSPKAGTPLFNEFFPDDINIRNDIEELNKFNIMEILELRNGISVHAKSYVGRVRIGQLEITISPKIAGIPLMNLLRYAYGLRNLKLFSNVNYDSSINLFQDLLIDQLTAEAFELVSRGLHRKYLIQHEDLASPRGRIDINMITRRGGFIGSTLPCYYYPRLQDCLINQVLLAGLHLGTRITSDTSLRMRIYQVSKLFEDNITKIDLTQENLRRLDRETNRLVAAYIPAIKIIKLLLNSEGISLTGDIPKIRLNGFMFNMDLFFQSLIERFLKENLQDYTVRGQSQIRDMLAYIPGYNPRGKHPPMPRPDYTILKDSRLISILDAKYCDLSENDLPAAWLYQLAVYALSQDVGGQATILYPTTNNNAIEARIQISDPVVGADRAQVIIRPVKLLELEKLISKPESVAVKREKARFARQLVFGDI